MVDVADCVSCGLVVDANNNLGIATDGLPWPFACAESTGRTLYCGPDGVLRTSEEPALGTIGVLDIQGNPNVTVTAGASVFVQVEVVDSPNPSLCLDGLLIIDFDHEVSISPGPGSAYAITFGPDVDVVDQALLARRPGPSGTTNTSWTLRRRDIFTAPPGGIIELENYKIVISCLTGSIVVERIELSARTRSFLIALT